jgi:hypothetical protein
MNQDYQIAGAAGINEVISDVFHYLEESEKTKREIARYDCATKVLITAIKSKYHLLDKVVTNVFAERRAEIYKCFEVIDSGLSKNDNELVNIGMSNLTNVVVSSPLPGLAEFAQKLKSGTLPPL